MLRRLKKGGGTVEFWNLVGILRTTDGSRIPCCSAGVTAPFWYLHSENWPLVN